ncbi:hypothetical protein [Gardnerella swidsinskii]|nr:hypothetical protein GV51_1232 [Gardnerella vaginalis 5-1]
MGKQVVAPCVRLAQTNPRLADRMFSTVEDERGKYMVDALARAEGVKVCESCPLISACLASYLVDVWEDNNIIGGLNYVQRLHLAHAIAEDFHVSVRQLGSLPLSRVKAWLETHPGWREHVTKRVRTTWRETKRLQRAIGTSKRKSVSEEDKTRAYQPQYLPPVPTAVQLTLF